MKHFFSFLGKLVDRVEEWSNLAGVWLIVFLMALIISDVAYRTLAGRSILGAYNLAEIVMVGICFFSLAYAQKKRGHVRMEVLVDRLRGKALHLTEIVAFFVSLAICALIFYQSILEALLAVDINLITSGIIQWPAWPFKIVVAFGFFLLCIRIGIQLTQQIRLLVAEGKHHAL